MRNEKHRQHFRLSYPYTYRPIAHIDFDEFEVENISREGLKILTDSDLNFLPDDTVLGTISFTNGREFSLDGHVVRASDNYVCLQLDTPLPKSVMRTETVKLMHNYQN